MTFYHWGSGLQVCRLKAHVPGLDAAAAIGHVLRNCLSLAFNVWPAVAHYKASSGSAPGYAEYYGFQELPGPGGIAAALPRSLGALTSK